MKGKRQMKVVAIIPSRYASTRFPGKPLVNINGKSLIQRTYENAKKCSLLDEIIIATDDQRIYDHVKQFNAPVVMTPENFATGSDRLAYVVENDPNLQEAEIIINIQGDEPCLDPETTKRVIEILRNDPVAVMSTAIFKITSEEEAQNTNSPKCIIDLHGNALYFSRTMIPGGRTSQYRPDIAYYKHIGIYAFRPDFLLQYGKLPMTPLQIAEDLEQLKVLEHGYRIKAAIVDSISLDVNIPEDIKKVEQVLCKQNT